MRKSIVGAIILFLCMTGFVRAATSNPKITIVFRGCTHCAADQEKLLLYKYGSRHDVISHQAWAGNGGSVSIQLSPGYYTVSYRPRGCFGERLFAVLPDHDRTVHLPLTCPSNTLTELIDDAVGIAGSLPPGVVRARIRNASGVDHWKDVDVENGMYYADRRSQAPNTLELFFANGDHVSIAVDATAARNFSVFRYDVSAAMITRAKKTKGSPYNRPEKLLRGPLGTIWALDPLGNRVDIVRPDRTVKVENLPSVFAGAKSMVASSSAVWVFESSVGRLVRFSPDGSLSEFDAFGAPSFDANADEEMTIGPDGRLWLLSEYSAVVGYDDKGNDTHVKSGLKRLKAIATGADGRIWVADKDALAAIDSQHKITLVPGFSDIQGIRAGRNGIWVLQSRSVAYMTYAGKVTRIALPFRNFTVRHSIVDRNDMMWFTDRFGNTIAYAKPCGTVVASFVSSRPSQIGGLAVGPDGNVWYSAAGVNRIEEFNKRMYFVPFGIDASSIAFDAQGNFWYAAPHADVIGSIPVSGHSFCFALPLAVTRDCATSHADKIGP